MPTFDCPTCGKSLRVADSKDAPYRPFCCERCKLVDLGRWLDGSYAVIEPVSHQESDEGVKSPPENES